MATMILPGDPPGTQDDRPRPLPLPEEQRHRDLIVTLELQHKALLRMLGHVKDALRVDTRTLYRAAALAGYNANPDPAVGNADPGMKALWAEADAEALLAVGSDETDNVK